MQKQNVRTLSLIVCTFTYLLVGAAIFDALESENEQEDKRKLTQDIDKFKTDHGIDKEAWENITRNILQYKTHHAGIQWKFTGAFYFALTVITTIGYGFSSPKTLGGKMFCMGYALIGIPLNLIMFQSIGERLNNFITFILKSVKKCFKMKRTDVSHTNLIIVAIHLCTLVLAGGGLAFTNFEPKWDYLESLYYCYITLTTIGFGDFVALQQEKSLQQRPEYVAFCLIFILFGLAIYAAAINLLVLRFMTMNIDETEGEKEIEGILNATNMSETDIIPATTVKVQSNGTVHTGRGIGNHKSFENEELLLNYDDHDRHSVCSCSCYSLRSKGINKPKHYTVKRSPGTIEHLLPKTNANGVDAVVGNNVHTATINSVRQELYNSAEDLNAAYFEQLQQKRASV